MHLHRSLFFNLKPATLLKKRRRLTYFPLNLAKVFRSNFIRKNSCELVLKGEFNEKWRTGILIRDIVKLTALSKNIDCEGKVYLRTIDRKLIVIVIFNSLTDVSFLINFTNIFFYLLLCSGKIWECFKVQLSVTFSVCFIT